MTRIAPPGKRKCDQCGRLKPLAQFVGARGVPIRTCKRCQKLYRSGGRAPTRRWRLDKLDATRVRFVLKSGDRKLGGIPATYSAGATCPDACPLKDAGCYAEFGFVRHQWEQAGQRAVEWPKFLTNVRALPLGQLWRHNIAGDLPGVGDALDGEKLTELIQANAGRRGFTFTHKPLRSVLERALVAVANRRGFTINLSADTLAEADELAALGIGPVAVTLPSDAPNRGLQTPAGRIVVVCPAERTGISCVRCQLCAKPQRKAIVGFRAHGQWHKRIDGRLRLPVV